MGSKKALLLLVGIVCLLYLPFVHNAFISDDIQGIVEAAPSWTWLSALGWPRFIHLSVLFQYVTYLLFGLVPEPFRILNILFHAGSVVLVYGIVATITKRQRVGFVSALVFAVHPLVTESVTWISGGVYAIYSLFFLLSLYLYIRATKKPFLYVLSLALFLLSLATSEKAISLVLVFVVYEWFFGNLKLRWKKLIPHVLLSALLILFYVVRIGDRTQVLFSSMSQSFTGLQNPFKQIPIAISSYLSLFVFPVGLTLYHSELAFAWWNFTVRVMLTLAAGWWIVYAVLKKKPIGFWLLWFVIALLPTLTPFKIGWIVAERYVYLSLVALCVIVGIVFDRVLYKRRLYVPMLFAGIVVILLFCIQTMRRNAEWVNQDTLWIATARTSPSNPATWNNMGDVYARRGDHTQAAAMFLKAIAINPRYADAYHNLGHTYLLMGRFAEAKESYAQAISFNPSLWQSYRDFAVILYEEGARDEARAMLSRALSLAPLDETLLRLQVLMEKGQ